jgi:hypothetical protein
MIVLKKAKYLNNKSLLEEIHKSKCSFSSFADPKYKEYDIIVNDISEITPKIITEARKNRAKRVGLEQFLELKSQNKKTVKLLDVTPDYKKISKSDIVVRVMTYDHIPLTPGRKKSVKTTADAREKINFPPFQHWKFDESNNLTCVGKSHWKGSIDTGTFSKDHGRITENLGKMFIILSERYSQKSNWRNYSYIEEMKGQAILQLSQIGLQFDESKSSNPFAYYTSAMTNSFTRILNLEKKNQNIRDDLLEYEGLTPSTTRQNSEHFAEETAKQALYYKTNRSAKSVDTDE